MWRKGSFVAYNIEQKRLVSDIDAYQEEIISLKHNLHCNNFPDSVTSAPRNLDWMIENDTRKLVVYWPPTRPNMPFQRRRKLHIPLASYGKRLRRRAWLTIWDKVKIPRCSHKLMHRKRVTCERHDSYFRSIMIKNAIPKTAEVAYSVGQLWEEIKLS